MAYGKPPLEDDLAAFAAGAIGGGLPAAVLALMEQAALLQHEPQQAQALLEQARALGQLRRDADLDLALQMLAGSVFARRMAGQVSEPGWAERAVDAIWKGMGPDAA